MAKEEGQREEVPDAENDAPEQLGSTRSEEAGREVLSTQDRCDTGVISKPEYGGIKRVIRLLSIIHNGIILDLVRGFGGSAGEDVRADFLSFRVEKSFLFIGERASEKG